jgi:hypothetical protein
VNELVRVRDRQTGDLAEYELVGAIESDIADGRVSVDAPVGRALIRHGAGAVVDVETPSETVGLKVLSVRTRDAPCRRSTVRSGAAGMPTVVPPRGGVGSHRPA